MGNSKQALTWVVTRRNFVGIHPVFHNSFGQRSELAGTSWAFTARWRILYRGYARLVNTCAQRGCVPAFEIHRVGTGGKGRPPFPLRGLALRHPEFLCFQGASP